ncbi:MAG: flagellar assembly protein FliH [Pseudomonadota bacterium]
MSKGHEKYLGKVLPRREIQDLKTVGLDYVGGARHANPGSMDATEADAGMMTAEQLQALQEQAYSEAFAQGRQEGLQAGRQEMERLGAQLHKILAEIERPLEDLDQAMVDSLVQMVMSIARHLIRRELKTDPGQIVAVVREGVGALPIGARNVRLQLHPEDAQLVREALSIQHARSPWEILEDPAMTRGGCRIATENSQIDATVEARLAAIASRFFGDERGEDAHG